MAGFTSEKPDEMIRLEMLVILDLPERDVLGLRKFKKNLEITRDVLQLSI